MGQGSERSLKMLATALEKEEQGRSFYKDAIAKCSNELGKDIFRSLVTEEGVHIVRIKEIYTALESGKSWTSEWKQHGQENEDLAKLFRKRTAELGPQVKGETGDIEALEIGVRMEQSAIEFYLDQQTKAEDQLEKDFIAQMIAEERSHLRALEDLKLFFTDPQAWYSETERHGLDGA